MICHRDMTFCAFNADCTKAGTCPRALTDSIREDARRSKLPICQFAEMPDCHPTKDMGQK